MSNIIKARLGNQLTDLLKKYGNTRKNVNCFWVETELMERVEVYILADRDKSKEGQYFFEAMIFFDLKDKYVADIQYFKTTRQKISLFSFYGLSNQANPDIYIEEYESGRRSEHWKVREYDELVRLVEAAADMMMYYLPHIGTLEDFTKFLQAHEAGETNFAELTMPETDPNLRKLFAW